MDTTSASGVREQECDPAIEQGIAVVVVSSVRVTMSLQKKKLVVERPSKQAGPGVIVHRIHPSVGRFKHHGSSLMQNTRVKLCIKAAYAQFIVPVCGYGVFNTTPKVLEKARGAALK